MIAMADNVPMPVPFIPDTSEDLFYRTDMMRSIEKILGDDIVEENLKNFPLWSIVSKSYKLTFFEARDVGIQENMFEAEVCKLMRSIPPCLHSPNLHLKIGQARMIFHANLRRALGTSDRFKLNERTAQISQFKQIISSSPSQSGSSSSWWRRLIGR